MEQTVHRLQAQEGRRAGDEGRLPEGGEGLGLAVTEAVLGVRRLQGPVHREQVEQGGPRVQGRVDQGGQHAHRPGGEPGRELGGDQQGRGRD